MTNNMNNTLTSKNKIIQFRVSNDDYEKIQIYANRSSHTISEYCRRILDSNIPIVIDDLPIYELKKKFNSITSIGNLQSKLNHDLIHLMDCDDEITQDYYDSVCDLIIDTRKDLIKEIREVKVLLKAILQELR